ncbi:16S rRNA (cytidine(1402)-2'-O)-methyltransferase [soil metagenome]
MSGILYIVATPIGNLEDITLRAISTLKEVDIILAEDTRKTSILLHYYEIDKHSLSYHQQSPISRKQEILNYLIEGKNIALVTDAGTPGISDPGNELIDFVLTMQPDIKIVPIPGASSITSALSASGFNTSNFLFIGFWPKKKTKKLLERIKTLDCPIVFFESPFRISKTINLLIENFGESKRIFIGQELTKLHERTLRTSLLEGKLELENEVTKLGRVKGELVCILES